MNFRRIDLLGRDPKTKEKVRLVVLSAFFDYPRCIVESRHSSSYEYWYDEKGKHVCGISNYGFRKINKRRNHSIRVNIAYHINHWKKITKNQLLSDLLNDTAHVQVKIVPIDPLLRYTEGAYPIPSWYTSTCFVEEIDIVSEDFDKRKDCFIRRLLKEKEKDFDE